MDDVIRKLPNTIVARRNRDCLQSHSSHFYDVVNVGLRANAKQEHRILMTERRRRVVG